jgi:O-antigen/teichoic acid export membrane protein
MTKSGAQDELPRMVSSEGTPGEVDLSLITRRLVNNISALTLAQLFYRLTSLFLSILLARYLGVAQQGVYGQIQNFIAVFGAFCDLGIANLVIRDMNQNERRHEESVAAYFTLLVLTNVLLFSGALITAFVLRYDAVAISGIVLAGLGMALGGVSSAFYAVLAGRQSMKKVALVQSMVTVTIATGIVAVMQAGGRVVALTSVAAIAGCGSLVLYWIPASRMMPELRLAFRAGPALALLKRGLPFTLHVGIYVVFTRIDVLILRAMSDDFTLGIYTAATRLTFPLTVFSMMAVTAIFPVLSQYMREQPAVAYRIARSAMKWLSLAGLAIAIPSALFSSHIVRILFGAEYAPTAPVFTILIWYIPIFYSYQVINDLLVAANKLWGLVWISLACLLLNIVLNVILIPKMGAHGAAWTSVICEMFRCVVFLIFAGVSLGFHRTRIAA